MSLTVSSQRAVRLLLVAAGLLLVAYAVSDHPLYGGEPGFGGVQKLIAAAGVAVALCSFLPNRIAGGILLVTIASLATLAFAEIAGEIVLGARHRPIYQADDRLIFKFIPDRRSMMTHARVNGGETVEHRINSQGFRGDELRPAGAMTRLVVYGDSFIHAFYTRQEETFVARLGASLAERLGRPVEAVNAGVSSYGPDQIALKMEDELDRLRPDLAIVAVFAGNDYGDLMRNKIFRLGVDGLLVDNRWKLDPQVRMRLDLSQRESILKRTIRSLIGAARATANPGADVTSSDFLLAEAQREYKGFVLDRDDVVTNTHVDYYSADISMAPDSASARYKVALMQAVLQRIRDIAARSGVPLVFLFIPHPADVSESNDWGMSDRRRFQGYDGRNQSAPLEAAAVSLGVPFLGLHELYRAHGAGALYLRGGDDHWNAAGQQLAATAMAELLVQQGLPRSERNPPTSSGTGGAPPTPPRAR